MEVKKEDLQKTENMQYTQNKRLEIQARQTHIAVNMKNDEIAEQAVESFAGEIIAAGGGGYSGEKKKALVVKKYVEDMKNEGANMTEAIAATGAVVPATAGIFAELWNNWVADGKTSAKGSLWLYKGVGYQARTEIQRIENYAPDLVPNNYAVRPIPDADGVYPTTMNMDVELGMKLQDGEDGKVYECYANPITSLQWQPHTVPSSFRLYEGE